MHGVPVRWFVRVGGDIRGPVDEATIAQWLAQGMRGAEVCPEGAGVFVRIEQTPLARFLPAGATAATGRRAMQAGGGAMVIALVLLTVFGRGMRVCNERLDEDKKVLESRLPTVGANGELRHDGALQLCPQSKHGWGWPCSKGRVVAQGSEVQIMKTGVFRMEGLCRYWVKGGPDSGASGDAPCAWFAPK